MTTYTEFSLTICSGIKHAKKKFRNRTGKRGDLVLFQECIHILNHSTSRKYRLLKYIKLHLKMIYIATKRDILTHAIFFGSNFDTCVVCLTWHFSVFATSSLPCPFITRCSFCSTSLFLSLTCSVLFSPSLAPDIPAIKILNMFYPSTRVYSSNCVLYLE